MKERAPLPGNGWAAARRAGRKAACRTALAGTTALAALALAGPVWAQQAVDPTDLFGGRGIIATPSARMAPDGELSAGASFLKNNQHYNFGFEVLPWLEATFRYSGLQHFHAGISGLLRPRLWREGAAVG